MNEKPKIGDIISRDCGYGGPDFQDCVIIRVGEGHNLFNEPRYDLRVRMPNQEEFETSIPREES